MVRPARQRLGFRSVDLESDRNSLILGILYLTFQAFPIIFRKHNFSDQEIGLTFLGIGIGMGIALSAQPYFNRFVLSPKLTVSAG